MVYGKGENTMLQNRQEKVFNGFNYAFFIVLSLLMIYPFWEVIRISFSSPASIANLDFQFIPNEISFSGYDNVMSNKYLWMGYKNTIIRILVGMCISMTLMVSTAYPLSKKYLPWRTFFTVFIVFTMFFGGGLIPSYLLITKTLHLNNTIWALVLPGAITTFSMLILRNYFMSIPESLEESAKIDGATELTILTRIILPLSKPILMTILLWGIVGHGMHGLTAFSTLKAVINMYFRLS